ncbi:M28 family peptidase [Flavobacterium sp. NST-5]|uniref:Vacuolar membrane protease n=1 Tax=Flavobacterium ichthyis TaxID=2698827 RepID=A0ABW9Z807_9FLAO|nr:M28 family peptidase [Flavobacterium ichthyis]NBL65016.1 M28 family peptidase [Flavobacterium ichthyis]
MKNNYTSLISALIFVGLVFLTFYLEMPQDSKVNGNLKYGFSIEKSIEKVKQISALPHYVSSENHQKVGDYLIAELKKLGLTPEVQEGFTLTEWGNFSKSRNIIAKIKGTNANGKAVMLLSHYDSAPHSASYGAADDASGIATILEGIRAFKNSKKSHQNDIIILFSDGEELGLNGAALFVTQHPWAKDVGVVLNFEARGTSGPSYMLMETNEGNAEMVKNFAASGLDFPVSNSLMYSIYKLLPNDTDLTVFRQQGQIQGFNFAFIDNHFNYHTKQDNFEHLSQETLAHQANYLMPLLHYFSNYDLSQLNSKEDFVYVNTPFGFIHYPFSWNFILAGIAGILLFFFVFLGIGKRILSTREILRGFTPFFVVITVSGAAAFLGWKILNVAYPQYSEILQGFTYNGHDYIGFFIFITLAICFAFYKNFYSVTQTFDFAIAPLLIWFIINILIAIFLPGAGFFILPVFAGIIMLAVFVLTQKSFWLLNLILSIPAIVIFVPFVVAFPIGLGLKMLFGSAILTALVFALLIPVFGFYPKKKNWSLVMLILAIGFLAKAHFNSNYEEGQAKQNSLVYFKDVDTGKAFWLTYDENLDEWTNSYLGKNPQSAKIVEAYNLFSKYNTKFTFSKPTETKNFPEPSIQFIRDEIIGDQRYIKIIIKPNRKVNRYDIFANTNVTFHNLRVNGVLHVNQKKSAYKRNGRKLLSYYVTNNEALEMSFSIKKGIEPDLELIEASFDLLENPEFSIKKRENWMMPKPFVLTDAIVLKQKIKANFNQEIIPQQLTDSIENPSENIIPDAQN